MALRYIVIRILMFFIIPELGHSENIKIQHIRSNYLNNTWTLACVKTSPLLENSEYGPKYVPKENQMTITLISCPVPELSYATFLNQIGFNPATIDSLILRDLHVSSVMTVEEKHFKGLFIKTLVLQCKGKLKPWKLGSNVLNPLPYLIRFKAFKVQLPPMPLSSQIVDAEFGTGESLGSFGGCDHLETLVLHQWTIPNADRWLASCPRLKNLILSVLTPKLVAQVLEGSKFIVNLGISDCDLAFLPDDFFNDMQDLAALKINTNALQVLPFSNSFPALKTLITSNNMISSNQYEVARFLKNSLKLIHLDASYNARFDLCEKENNLTDDVELGHPHLEVLILAHTSTTLTCLRPGSFPSLKYLDLRSSDIEVVQFQYFQLSDVSLEVNLWYNYITEVQFTESDYNNTLDKVKSRNSTVTLLGSIWVVCDCTHGWFASAVRNKLILAPNTHCYRDFTDTEFTLIPREQLECEKSPCGSCQCRRYWSNNSLVADCRDTDNITRIPDVVGLNKVIAPSNRIVLRANDLPDTLTFLDLTNNDISRMDLEVAKMLFSVKERHVLLSGNPILCDCDNYDFIQTLQMFKDRIDDYSTVKCAGNSTTLGEVLTSDLCREVKVIYAAISAGGVVLVIAVIIAAMYRRYGPTIRMFLYARGLLCCIHEDALDSDRQYDAFISYCHQDAEVAEEIVAKLEERGFIACVHYRDWMPGEMIPTQIVQSVEKSRRTIIVLSRNFLESMWGLLEFRSAHVRALKEGVLRVILIVVDDVVDADNLDVDLRSYIKMNTYVRYDDAWFWDKLYYAMPRRRMQSMTNTSSEPPLNHSSLSNFPAVLDVPGVVTYST